jgi:hypothetical protein
LRTCGKMTAIAPHDGRQGQLIGADHDQHDPCNDPRRRPSSTLLSTPLVHKGCPVTVGVC